LSGAVTEASFGTIKEIAKAAAKANQPRLEWEPDTWAVLILRRLQIAVLECVGSALTRTLGRLPHQRGRRYAGPVDGSLTGT
jgi:hypothetical protein